MSEKVTLLSEDILPLHKREKASKDEWSAAYLELESEMIDILRDGSVDFYEAFTAQLKDISTQVRDLKVNVKDPGNDVKLMVQLMKEGEPIFRGFKTIRENSKLDRILIEKKKDISMRHVKNKQ